MWRWLLAIAFVFLAVAMGNGVSGRFAVLGGSIWPLASMCFGLMPGMLGFEALWAWQPCAGRRAFGSVWGFFIFLGRAFCVL